MSRDQKRTALRVPSIPEEEFELTVESEQPTVTEMPERGTRKTIVVDYGMQTLRSRFTWNQYTSTGALVPDLGAEGREHRARLENRYPGILSGFAR